VPTRISPAAISATRTPAPTVAHPASSSHGRSAPALTPVSTPRDASAFITTTDQLPSLTSHVTCCRPAPRADAAQKDCVAGRAGRAAAGTVRYCALNGEVSTSVTIVWDVPRR
jgi:hypothetical protein